MYNPYYTNQNNVCSVSLTCQCAKPGGRHRALRSDGKSLLSDQMAVGTDVHRNCGGIIGLTAGTLVAALFAAVCRRGAQNGRVWLEVCHFWCLGVGFTRREIDDCDYISVPSRVESDPIDDWPRCLATDLSARPGDGLYVAIGHWSSDLIGA